MNDHLTWYVARASGIVTWGLLVASMVWGVLYATRALGRRASSWWLLGVHRFLGALVVLFTAVHVIALVADNFVHFGVADVLVPFVAQWRTLPVGLGVIGMYLLVAIEATSLVRSRLPYRVWRALHLASYGLFALATIHALASGTDTRAVFSDGLAVALGALAIAVAIVALDRRTAVDPRRPVPAPRRSVAR
ncbi:MAG: ferric reductase-like transmembrane domain-containing protein [Acidimicrobiia bacterium]